MSAKPKTTKTVAAAKKAVKKVAAKKVAAKKAAKPTASKSVSKPDLNAVVEDGTEIVFIGFQTPIEGVSELNIGDTVFISSRNEDDGSYNVSRTAKGKEIDTLYRKEFRLASEDAGKAEIANKGKNGGAPLSPATKEKVAKLVKKAAKPVKTDAEAYSGTKKKVVKDGEGRTVVEKKEKPVKVAKPAPEVIPVTLLPALKKTVSEAGGLIQAAEALADRVGETEYSLGGILGKISETNAFEELVDEDNKSIYGEGHVGFGKFCEAHLGIKYRKATYLIGNYVAAVACGITAKQMAGIGWSKFKEAVAVLTIENKDEILAEAKAMPYDSFKAAMKQRLVNGGGKLHGNSKADQKTFTFRLHNDKGAVALEALAKARGVLGIEGTDIVSQSQAFDHIVSEWLSMKD